MRGGLQHPAVRAALSPRWRQAAAQRRVHIRAAAAAAVSLPELPVLDGRPGLLWAVGLLWAAGLWKQMLHPCADAKVLGC